MRDAVGGTMNLALQNFVERSRDVNQEYELFDWPAASASEDDEAFAELVEELNERNRARPAGRGAAAGRETTREVESGVEPWS